MSEPVHQPKAHTQRIVERPLHPRHKQKRQLVWVMAISGFVMILEIVGGVWTQGLSLLSDAFHVLADFVAYGITVGAIILANRDAPPEKTYRYWRVEILAALLNGILLLVPAGVIVWEAVHRFADPAQIDIRTVEMLVVASIGLAANLSCAGILKDSSKHDVNIRGAFLHVVSDVLSSIGVIVAGVLILLTGNRIFDPLMAVVIAFMVVGWSIRQICEAGSVLLEWAPKSLKIDEVIAAIKGAKGVEAVHDVHVWVITSRMYSLTAHIVLENDLPISESALVAEEIDGILDREFDITHTCYQFEVGAK